MPRARRAQAVSSPANVVYGPATVDVARGVVLRCAENALIANNTFVGLQDFVFTLQHEVGTYGGSIEGLRIINNVMLLGGMPRPTASTARFRLRSSSTPTSCIRLARATSYDESAREPRVTSLVPFAQWTDQEAHGLSADPLFVDANARL